MLDTNTKKRIDDCRDILVGKLPDPKAQIDQITLALIYKFMDDMDQQSKSFGGVASFFVGEFEKYTWSNIVSVHIGANDMLKLYSEGIEKMSENVSIQPLFRSIFKDAYLPYRDPETLKMFLKKINEFSYDHSEILGDAFEYLLSVMGSQGDAGQFRTPRHIIDFMVNITSPKKDETILDPSCGTSGFLISAYKKILSDNTKERPGDLLSSMEKKRLLGNVSGYDISPDMIRLSLANLFLHGFNEDNLKIFEYDTLTSLDRWNEYYDVILANPPFMTPKGGIRPHNRFSVKSKKAEVLFVNYIMDHLTPKGRAAIVVPEGIILQSKNAYKDLRKSLIEKSLIGVVSLPSGLFNPYSMVKTSILILDRVLSKKTDEIFFAKVENDGYNLGSQRTEIDKDDLPKIKDGILEYLQNLSDGVDKEQEDLSFVSKEEILNSSDIGLNFNRYKINEIQSSFEVYELKELVEFKRGKSITKKDVVEGKYPVIAGGQKPAYYHNEYNRDGETITVSSSGAYSGFVNYFDKPIFMSDSFSIKPTDTRRLSSKFLYHLLKNKQNFIYTLQTGAGQPHIYPKSFDSFKIPLPPIEIQNEIIEEIEQIQLEIEKANFKIQKLNIKIEDRINKIWGS
jgi:type I restriction enzyme M protein